MRLVILALLLSMPLQVIATEPTAKGVWQGTLGTRQITVCFNEVSPEYTNWSSYYYNDFLKPIQLTKDGGASVWKESEDTGQWEIGTPRGDVLTGTWRNPKTNKTLPITLQRVETDDVMRAPCASDAYNVRLETPPKVVTSRPIQFAPGRSYRKLSFAGQETIQLIGAGKGIERINFLLKPDQSKDAIDEYFGQRRQFLGSVGYPAVDERDTEPDYWDANFITVRFYTWAAGTGRNGISNEYRTWDLKTGEEVDLWQWIGASFRDPRLPPKLKNYLYKNTDTPSDCRDGYRGEGDFTITLAAKGLKFEEEAWGEGCEKAFFVPYEKLGPFLSPMGRRELVRIMKAR